MGPEALKVEIRRVGECELVVRVCAVSLCTGKKKYETHPAGEVGG